MLTDETERDLVEPHLVPVDDVTLHLPFEVADYVDFYCSLRPRHQRRPDLPARRRAAAPNWRHLPVGYHGRAGTVVVSGTDVVRPQRPAQAAPTAAPDLRARAAGSTSRPSSASSSARRPASATGSPPTAFADHVFGAVAAQRLVGARHPGLGVRPARPVPRQVVRHLGLRAGSPRSTRSTRPGSTCPARTPSRCAYLARRPSRPGFDIDIEVRAQRRGGQPAAVRLDVLVARPDARPPDRQRRLAAHRRPVRAPARSAARSRTSAARSSSCPGAAPSRSRRRRGRTFLEDGDR